MTSDPAAITPLVPAGQLLLKRDDLYECNGIRGGKVRTCWQLAQGARGLVTAGSRHSPQIAIVAAVAEELGIPAVCYCPTGEMTGELRYAEARGADLIRVTAGYNNVIIARAREHAAETGYREIPFGMECQQAVDNAERQAAHLPWPEFKRIIVPVGSGMTFAGILSAARAEITMRDLPVIGVQVGADPSARIHRWCPLPPVYELEQSRHAYAAHIAAIVGGVTLDPVYEAKALEYCEPGDLLWLVGIRPPPPPAVQEQPDARQSRLERPQSPPPAHPPSGGSNGRAGTRLDG